MPHHDDPHSHSLGYRHAAKVRQLRQAIEDALLSGRQICAQYPLLTEQIEALISRLEKIRRELDQTEVIAPSLMSGELYPFLVQRALGREP